jgi:hypothetical protein
MAMLYGFAGQMLEKGLKPSTVLNRVEEVVAAGTPVTRKALLKYGRRLQLDGLRKWLRREKNKVGTVHKVPWNIETLSAPLEYPDLRYVTWWYVLVASGARPKNLWNARIRLEETGLEIWYTQGTKSEQKRMRRPRFYEYAWSMAPPENVRRILEEHGELPELGQPTTIASSLNSWLKRNRSDEMVKLTSCVPRARMDHILRHLVAKGLLEKAEYEWVMDHTMETSNQSYYTK